MATCTLCNVWRTEPINKLIFNTVIEMFMSFDFFCFFGFWGWSVRWLIEKEVGSLDKFLWFTAGSNPKKRSSIPRIELSKLNHLRTVYFFMKSEHFFNFYFVFHIHEYLPINYIFSSEAHLIHSSKTTPSSLPY